MDRAASKKRGVRMAAQVASIGVGVGALAMAAAASAEEPAAASTGGENASVTTTLPVPEVKGWSCWGGPISRGPMAPPVQCEEDFEALLAEVPS